MTQGTGKSKRVSERASGPAKGICKSEGTNEYQGSKKTMASFEGCGFVSDEFPLNEGWIRPAIYRPVKKRIPHYFKNRLHADVSL